MGTLSNCDVFVDVCTQRDYLASAGAHPCVNAVEVGRNVKRLIAFARWEKVPTLSCVDARRPDEVRGLPIGECVLGTLGQAKVPCSLLPRRIVVESDNSLSVPLDLLERYQQAILVKRHRDPFTNPKLDRLLTEMPAGRFVIFGVPLEVSIRLLVLGLLLRGRKAAIVTDACGFWSEPDAQMAARQLEAKGCQLQNTDEYIQAAAARNGRAASLRGRRRRSVA